MPGLALDRKRVEENLSRFEPRPCPDRDLTPAAVAVSLLPDDLERRCFLITRRAESLSAHAGQWALPGGRIDPGESAEQAALRELREEVGLDAPTTSILGRLDDYPTRSGYVITPIVLWHDSAAELSPDPAEVQEIYRVPLSQLDRPEVPELSRIEESDRPVISIPLLETLGTLIHAPTAAVLYQLLEVALRGRSTRVAHFEQPVFAWR